MSNPHSIDLDQMQGYFVLGLDKDGNFVEAASPNVALQDLASWLARAQFNIQLQALTAVVRLEQAQKSAIVRPQMGIVPGGKQ